MRPCHYFLKLQIMFRAFLYVFLALPGFLVAQKDDFSKNENSRITALEIQLKDLSKKVIPGLKEKIDYSVSGVSIKEFLRALAEAASLNMHISDNIEGRVHNNFNGEKASNILLFLCREYDLDLEITGSIISVKQILQEQQVLAPSENFKVQYSSFDHHISVEARKDTLKNVLRKIIELSGKNVIPAPEISEKLISVFISDLPFESALDKLAFANGLLLEKTRDGSFLMNSNPLMVEEGAQNPRLTIGRSGKNFNQNRSTKAPQLYLEIIHSDQEILVDAELNDASIFSVLQELSERSGLNYIFFSIPPGSISLNIKAVPHGEFLDFLLLGSSYTYAEKNGVYLIGERSQEGLRSSVLVQFRYRSVDDLLETIPAELSRGMEIKVFEELNGLLISGSKPKINEIKNFIEPLDRLVPLILIEVVAIDVKKGRGVETGIKVGISDSIKTGGSLLPGLNFTFSSSSINKLTDIIDTKGLINLGKVNPNFYTSLQAMEKNNHIRIRSTPKLATLNGHPANLTIGQTEYYLEQTQNIQGSNNTVTTITPQYKEINADLNILIDPLVSAGDHVTLDIIAEFSSFTEPFILNGPPGKSTRKFESIIRVRNEEMIVLGGLEEQRKTRQTEGVPFLSRLPILRWLFSSVNQEKNETRLMVFIKPTIVY
jgi:type IV pilus assembly protein PilQ